jgi:hypothetical protein
MTRIIFIFLNIAICLLVIVSKTAAVSSSDSFILRVRNDYPDVKDTISPDFSGDFETGEFSGWYPEEGWEISRTDPIAGNYSLKPAISSSGGVSAIFHRAHADPESEDLFWSFRLKNGNWDPSSSNRFWFYLMADTIAADQVSGWAAGVNLKGSADLLELWRIRAGKADSLVIQTDLDWNVAEQFVIDVRRTARGKWTLAYRRPGEASGHSFSGYDATWFNFRNVGLLFQFTSTRAGQLWLDDVSLSRLASGLFIQKIRLVGSNTIVLIFNKAVLPGSVKSRNFRLTNEIGEEIPISEVVRLDGREIQLTVGGVRGTSLSLAVKDLSDLSGQLMEPEVRSFVYAILPQPGSVVINEILFHPFPGGVDFVEVLNVSENTLPVSKLKLAARDATLRLKQIYPVTGENRFLFPGEFLVCTKDTAVVASQYVTSAPETFCQMKAMPSFPDAAGTAVLLNDSLTVLDEFSYSAKMHSPFLVSGDGVSLERISTGKPSGDRDNWASAAASVGFATPGLPNSQSLTDSVSGDQVAVEPKAFSPNGDGYHDQLSISYRFRKPGYLANVRIFDLAGRLVSNLVKNESLAQTGVWKWNGQDDYGHRPGPGAYVILVEVFDRDGHAKAFKKACLLTERLD